MKEQILILIDGWFIHYGIAKILQEKYDCDLHTIIDIAEKPKKFFKSQKLVNFKNIWYSPEHITTKDSKIDLDYLKNFEKKYNINLWDIVFSDAEFNKFNLYYSFSENEIFQILYRECKLLDSIFSEITPEYLLTYVPNGHFANLVYQVCRSNGIKVLCLGPIRFGQRMMISEQPLKIDYFNEYLKNSSLRTKDEIKIFLEHHNLYNSVKTFKKINFEDQKLARYNSIFKFFFSFRSNDFGKRYYDYGKTRRTVFKTKLLRSIRRKYREQFINANLINKIEDESFIYFPLHVEPERLFLVDLPFYDNQITVLSNIARSIPIGYKLYVKEHPMMKQHGWREISYYKQIMKIPNVKLIHPSINPSEIIKKSSLVITIAGSTGQEAAFYEKPSITFTEQVYSILPSVHQINKIENLPAAINESLRKKVKIEDLSQFIDIIEKNTFEIDHRGLASEFAYRFNFKGPSMDAELPPEKVQKFLNEHKEFFETLANENIKKIMQHKEHQKESKTGIHYE